MNGPLSPEELARVQAYYGGNASNSSSADAPPMSTAPADYYGPPTTPAALPPPAPPPAAPGAATVAPVTPPPNGADPFALGLANPTPPPVISAPLPIQEVTGAPPNAAPSAPTPPAASPVVSVPVVKRGGGEPANAAAAVASGRGGSSDPFHINAANRAIDESFNQQKRGIEQQANAEATRDFRRAEAQEDLARTQREDASIERAEAQRADEVFAGHMNEIQNQIDDLRQKKIDPTKKLRDSGYGILGIVAGVIGGLYQGATKTTNPFLDELHDYMNRQMNIQQGELDNERNALGNQMNLLGQMRAIYKDSQLADSQARNLIYESTKQQIEAEAAKANDPIERARAEQAVADINRQQATLQRQIGEQARAQAAAAASQQFAQIKAARERLDKIYTETYDKVFQKSGNAAQAEYEAKRMVVQLTHSGGAGAREPGAGGVVSDPVMNVPQPQQEHAVKELEAKASADKGIEALRDAFAKYEALPATAGPWDRDREAIRAQIMGAYKQALGPGMSSDKDAETFLEPLMPQTGSSAEVNARKLALIEAQVASKVATPILDRYNPGWRGANADVKHYDLAGKPK